MNQQALDEQTRCELNELMEQFYQSHHSTEQSTEDQPRRVLNVYIEVEEPEQPDTIESSIDAQGPATAPEAIKSQQSEPLPAQPRRRLHTQRKNSIPLILLLVALIGLLIGLTYGLILPLLTPSATVTIVTAATEQTTTATIQIVNEAADQTKQQQQQQLTGRTVSSVTMSQQKTIPTTGIAHQDAKAGHGIITFYNAATYPQTIPAGTVLAGTDRVQLVTDTDAVLPAAIFPTFGQASVPAHAAIAGPGSNVRAGDVYGACCRLNISAVNGAFIGGQDERSYQIVTAQDINRVATSLKMSLEQSVQAALQTQVQSTETLITPFPCTQKVTPDHQPGEEATQVSIMIDETCTGTVYNTNAFTRLTTQIATQDATKRLATGYISTGIHTSITQATTNKQGSIDLQVKSVSMWTYQFNEAQQQAIRTMIVSMSIDKAKATLIHMTKIQSVSITTTNENMLPSDEQHIHLIFVQV